jgi:hypothetical protein
MIVLFILTIFRPDDMDGRVSHVGAEELHTAPLPSDQLFSHGQQTWPARPVQPEKMARRSFQLIHEIFFFSAFLYRTNNNNFSEETK